MIGIIDYGLGNLRSVAGAVEKVGFRPQITADPGELARADKLILPGVGAFGDGMANLRAAGLDEALDRLVIEKGKPILGICLGFQLLAEKSLEFGHHNGLGWIRAKVERLPLSKGLRLPHVGWNDLFQVGESVLFEGIADDALFYHVHSFHMTGLEDGVVRGECEYGSRFATAIEKDNIYGTQFHPEKSQLWGLKMLRNFLEKA